MFLTRGAVKNPIAVFMACIAVVVLSVIALQRLPRDLFPKITIPTIVVSAQYSGATPETMERTVTYPLEQAVTRVAGVQQILSTTRTGTTSIQVWFNWGTDLNIAEVEVIQNVQRVMRNLPTGVTQPFVLKFDISNIPVAQVVVGGGGLNARELYDLGYNTIEPQLERIPGVSQAFVNGGLVRQFNVDVDPNRLNATGLTLQGVINGITKYNALIPSGDLKNNRIDYLLNVPSLLQNVPAIQHVVLATHSGIPIHVADVAQVQDAAADQTQIVRINGKPGVIMFVAREPDANTIQVVDALRKALPRLSGIPKGVTLQVGFDQSQYIRAAIATLEREALVGAVLTFLVVLVFLRSLWSLVIIGVGIPLSVASALLLLYFTGQGLNIFTLGGLTLAMGRLVDDAIVVRENITRHLTVPGTPVLKAVLEATQEVGLPVLASTATTIAVFFPVVFLSGISQRLFVPMALTIVFALSASYVVSMTMDPILSIKLLRAAPGTGEPQGQGTAARFVRWSERLMESLDERYQRALGWTLKHASVVLAGIAVVFVISVIAARGIGTEFFPDTDESQFSVDMQVPQGTAVQLASDTVEQVANVVRRVIPSKDVLAVYTNTGANAGGFGSNAGPNYGSVEIKLVPPTRRRHSSTEWANAARAALNGKFPGVLMVMDVGGLEHRIVNVGSSAPIDIQLIGYNQQVGALFAQQVAAMVAGIEGTADVQITPRGQYPNFNVDVDQEKAAQLGMSSTDVANAVNTAMAGNVATASQFIDPVTGNEYNIVVRLQNAYRTHPEDLGNVPLNVLADPPAGTSVAAGTTAPMVPILLRDVARITLGSQPLQISRKNEQRVIDVTANVINRPLGAVSQDIVTQLDRITFPEGFTYHLAGQTEAQQGAFSSLGFALLLALMLVYMIMASQFMSLVDPFIIMFAVPLGFIGVIWMLLLTHTTLSIISFMGVITMIGVVVSNGILLVDYANKMQERGMAAAEAVLQAGRIRLRPILMTAIATVLGMIPMATGLGEGSETNMPLARAVIGGLTVSTALTLLVIPVMYVFFERLLPRRRSREA
ncbi:MAG TPA: efflux RND transporter permease subunit [bacterium]|nr:efflux RND transporter permease subunit [bacterium]